MAIQLNFYIKNFKKTIKKKKKKKKKKQKKKKIRINIAVHNSTS